MDEFETFLENQTLHVSPLKALMREVDVDVMEGLIFIKAVGKKWINWIMNSKYILNTIDGFVYQEISN